MTSLILPNPEVTIGLRIGLRIREENRWEDNSKKECRGGQCCEDNGGRDEESPLC